MSKISSPTSEEPPRSSFFLIRRSVSINEDTNANWKIRKVLRPRICLLDSPSPLVSQIRARLVLAISLKIGIPISLALATRCFSPTPSPAVRNDPLPRVPSLSKRNLVVSPKASACIVENLVTFASIVPRNPSLNTSRQSVATRLHLSLSSSNLQVFRKTPSPKPLRGK